ncbi:hypothetical protein A0J61_11457 [Choanephora cucurbitarum]|uniref:Uncharacterized protein n=1 Tax=Choanephora cucurbitarum TaxID=101091 RepID=A0A1C7MZD7_9FUNG|nr:hypothetical protein A0J61_11457 [Choanephora cucurbitarum]
MFVHLLFLPVQFTSFIFDSLLKMISFIQATMKTIAYSGFECVDHLIQLHMSTDIVKNLCIGYRDDNRIGDQ